MGAINRLCDPMGAAIYDYYKKGKAAKLRVFSPDFDESVQMIMDSNGISREKAILIHTEMWMFVHGIGTMFATSFLTLEWETVSNMITDIYQGLRVRHMTENNENGCN